MKTLLQKIKSWINHLLTFLPSPLPVGMKEFDAWSDSIINAYGLPNNDSVKFALAAQIMHLPQTEARKPRRYFGLSLLKGSANQVAHAVMQDLKAKQAREEAERKAAEAQAALLENQQQTILSATN